MEHGWYKWFLKCRPRRTATPPRSPCLEHLSPLHPLAALVKVEEMVLGHQERFVIFREALKVWCHWKASKVEGAPSLGMRLCLVKGDQDERVVTTMMMWRPFWKDRATSDEVVPGRRVIPE